MKLNILLITHILCLAAIGAESLPDRLSNKAIAVHRSGSPIVKEANRWAINRSIRKNADIIEMDIRLTKDGEVVVFHDGTIIGKTLCGGTIESSSFERLKKCRLFRIHKIMRFEDALTLIGNRAVLNAEFKTDEVIGPAIEIVQKHAAWERVYFQVQDSYEKYHSARAKDPDVYLQFAARNYEHVLWTLEQNDPKLLIVQLNTIVQTQEVINLIHSHGKLISLNTWKDAFLGEMFKANCKKYFDLGADIVVTHSPRSCRKQLKNEK